MACLHESITAILTDNIRKRRFQFLCRIVVLNGAGQLGTMLQSESKSVAQSMQRIIGVGKVWKRKDTEVPIILTDNCLVDRQNLTVLDGNQDFGGVVVACLRYMEQVFEVINTHGDGMNEEQLSVATILAMSSGGRDHEIK